jgi:hypothetical protein
VALPPDGLLADPARLAVLLGVPADDPKLIEALREASGRFIGAVRWPVRRTEGYTVTVYGTGSSLLLLPVAELSDVDQVLVDGTAVTDYQVRRDIGALRRTGCAVWEDWAEVTVTCTCGYDPIPEDIQSAVTDQARTKKTVRPGIQTVQAGGESITYGAQAVVGVTDEWTTAVTSHRLNRGDRA